MAGQNLLAISHETLNVEKDTSYIAFKGGGGVKKLNFNEQSNSNYPR